MAARSALQRAKRTATKQQPVSIGPQEVAQVAYALYLQRGRCDGYDQQDWFEAQRIVKQQRRPRKD